MGCISHVSSESGPSNWHVLPLLQMLWLVATAFSVHCGFKRYLNCILLSNSCFTSDTEDPESSIISVGKPPTSPVMTAAFALTAVTVIFWGLTVESGRRLPWSWHPVVFSLMAVLCNMPWPVTNKATMSVSLPATIRTVAAEVSYLVAFKAAYHSWSAVSLLLRQQPVLLARWIWSCNCCTSARCTCTAAVCSWSVITNS